MSIHVPLPVSIRFVSAATVALKLNKPVVVKAQVHVGCRGKAGGIKLASDSKSAKSVAAAILGMNIKMPGKQELYKAGFLHRSNGN